MKTYKREEYFHAPSDEQWGKTSNPNYIQYMNISQDFILCNCLRLQSTRNQYHQVRAYENCKNCFGYGIPPIFFEVMK